MPWRPSSSDSGSQVGWRVGCCPGVVRAYPVTRRAEGTPPEEQPTPLIPTPPRGSSLAGPADESAGCTISAQAPPLRPPVSRGGGPRRWMDNRASDRRSASVARARHRAEHRPARVPPPDSPAPVTPASSSDTNTAVSRGPPAPSVRGLTAGPAGRPFPDVTGRGAGPWCSGRPAAVAPRARAGRRAHRPAGPGRDGRPAWSAARRPARRR